MAQCVVVEIDSQLETAPDSQKYVVYQYAGDEAKTVSSTRDTVAWAREAQQRGAGEIVLNCMNNDGVKRGYDLDQQLVRNPRFRFYRKSGGATGDYVHFADLFEKTGIDSGLAASVFHSSPDTDPDLKRYLRQR